MKIAKESWILAAIGLADLVTTIIFIKDHGAQEANPLFRRYWDMGIPAFIAAKMVCLLGPLLVMEWARSHSERFVNGALRTAIAGYLLLYCVGYLHLNAPHRGARSEGSNYVISGEETPPAWPALLRWQQGGGRQLGAGSSLAWKPICRALLKYRRTGQFHLERAAKDEEARPMPVPVSYTFLSRRDG